VNVPLSLRDIPEKEEEEIKKKGGKGWKVVEAINV